MTEQQVHAQDTGDGFIRSGRVRFHDALAPMLVRIDTVQPAPFNYNNGDVEAVVESVATSGMYRPIFTRKETGEIIAGNHTWMACKELGSDVVPVVALDVDDIGAKRIMVADNQTARLAKPDPGLLQVLLDEIDDASGLMGTGFNDHDLEVLRALNDIPLDTDEFGQWPTFTVKLPPHVLQGFMHMTREADDDRARFELLLRLAGWDGRGGGWGTPGDPGA